MDNILTENVLDSRLESCDSTNLFDCLTSDNMNDENDHVESDPPAVENNQISIAANDSDAILSFIETTSRITQADVLTEKLKVSSNDSNSTETNSVKADSDKGNDFIPTIVDIRGACENSLEQSSHENDSDKISQKLPIVSDSQGGVENSNSNKQDESEAIIAQKDSTAVHTIDDGDDVTHDTCAKPQDALISQNVVIKQEPREEDTDNDCMLIESDDINTCFTSEIEIKEERSEDDDSEVLCIESSSEIPLPIPIKIEANFENDTEVSISKPSSTDTKAEETKKDDSSDTKSTTKPFTAIGYTCHLCNTTFQEHELLNEHMKLHRNNSLVERLNKTNGKHRKLAKYVCRTCGKRLSTGQSLAQHTMIHNNEKPHVCPICKKDFRHLSNFKMHVLKHKEEEEQRRRQREKHKLYARLHPPPLDRSIARSADFGRLVGPLFVKETLLSKSTDISRPMIAPKIERKPFELKFPKARENAKENLIFFKTNNSAYEEPFSRARKFNDDIGDDVIPLKTFNNVDNIVMNATKFIVKVDNLDANLLKKKIKTPDISIDKSAENRPPDRKRRIALSPSDSAKKVKLDQIENIIMDDSPMNEVPDDDGHSYDDRMDFDVDELASATNKQETLTDNELFELLNDDRVDDKPNDLVQSTKTPPKSNVIVLPTKQSSPQTPAVEPKPIHPPSPPPVMDAKPTEQIAESAEPVETINLDDDDEEDVNTCDMYDNIFRNVALRRLTLIRKKAAQNGGKVENKYLLGPLFWRKALQKAQKNQLDKDPPMSLNETKLAFKRTNSSVGKVDSRRTNDPAKLQQRAEMKLQYVLERIKAMTDVSHVNITGPLFWKRTLKLAGVHTPRDLKRLLVNEKLSIDDVQFVDGEELPTKPSNSQNSQKEINGETVVIDDEEPPAPPAPKIEEPKPVVASDFLENVETKRLNSNYVTNNDRIVDSILNDDLLKKKPQVSHVTSATSSSVNLIRNNAQVLKTTADSTKELESAATKAESILYDSLTKPRAVPKPEPAKRKIVETAMIQRPTPVVQKQTPGILRNRAVASASTPKQVKIEPKKRLEKYKPLPEPTSVQQLPAVLPSPVTTSSLVVHEVPDSTTLEGGNIILNVDSADFQLIADSKAENGEETNYVLVTDENGGVQLIKENDLQLVEDEASNTQYVVNMQGENFNNFDLLGNTNGEQLTYTIQLDNDTYTTLQFVQDGDSLNAPKEKIDEKSVNIGGTNYVIADPSTDLNHIGKELSDFLHIDYGTLLKGDQENQQT